MHRMFVRISKIVAMSAVAALAAASVRAEPMLQIRLDSEKGLYKPGEKVKLEIALEGREGPDRGAGQLNFRLVDFFGSTVWKREAKAPIRNGTLWSGETPELEPGFYSVKAEALTVEGSATGEADFAVIGLPRKAPDSQFGVCFGDPKLMPLVGAQWARAVAAWNWIEPKQGEYDFSMVDGAVNEYLDGGRKVLGILVWPPEWAQRKPDDYAPITEGPHAGWGIFPPNNLQAWGDFVFETVAHYKGKVSAWEIWNEPWNEQLFWIGGSVEDYVALLKTAYERAKEADPDAIIVGVGGADSFDYFQKVMDAGGFPYMDAVSLHDYQAGVAPEEGGYLDLIDKTAGLIEELGGGKQLWITESGWPTHEGVSEGWKGATLDQQANYLARAHILAFERGVEKFFWFSFSNAGLEPDNFEHNQGLFFNDLTPKPSAPAYAASSRMLAGKKAVLHKKFADGKGRAAVFSGEGEAVMAVWAPGEAVEVKVDPELLREASLYDMMGAKRDAVNGKILVGESPFYVVGPSEESVRLVAGQLK